MTKPRGFTLIEAIAVIAITGIIAGVVAVFIARPIQGYVDSVRRAALSDMADTALRRIGRDVRTAVPNSLRVTGTFLEFVPTSDGGRYRVEPAPGAVDILDFTSGGDDSFEVFGVSPLAAAPGDELVIFNTGQPAVAGCVDVGADIYQGCNRRAITNASSAGISFTATGVPLPFDSPAHRFQVVPASGPVTYACQGVGLANGNGTGTLRRFTGYGYATPQPVVFAPPITGALLADSVSACAINYVAAVSQRQGIVTLQLTLTRANESVTLYHEVHVDNQP